MRSAPLCFLDHGSFSELVTPRRVIGAYMCTMIDSILYNRITCVINADPGVGAHSEDSCALKVEQR